MIIASLIILFLLKIRFPDGKPISETIRTNFGQDVLSKYRNLENTWRKHSKAKQDLHFINCCKIYNVFPNFLKIKLFRKDLYNGELYREFQSKLLDLEIRSKESRIQDLETKMEVSKSQLRNATTVLNYLCLTQKIKRNISKCEHKTRENHRKKMETLGGRLEFGKCDPESVIFNFSNRTLIPREKFLLSLGLDFKLPAHKPDFYKFFTCFEALANNLKPKNIANGLLHSDFCLELKQYARELFQTRNKAPSHVIKKGDIDVLKNLAVDKSLYINRPDKGRGVVILNKSDYISKMEDILKDSSKFEKSSSLPFSLALSTEDKVNRTLAKMKKLSLITDDVYRNVYSTGSSPGVLYGLTKVHKEGHPLRPILAAYNTASYRLSKYVISLIESLSTNEYCLRNSYQFSDEIKSFKLDNRSFMVSFDVSSLYTNVPVSETIDLICSKLFSSNNSFGGYSKKLFRELLCVCVTNTYFFFNNVLYKQIEGLAMGNPLAPTMANIFMCNLEESFLTICPPHLKPKFYKRYLDDVFAVFETEKQAEGFQNYINSAHPNIKFTLEKENDNKISYLDILVCKFDEVCQLSVYRKPTFTNLGTSFFSFVPNSYKTNAIKTLIHRAYYLSSTWALFHSELEKLKKHFYTNGYPIKVVESRIRRFLDEKLNPKPIVTGVQKDILYVKLPFLGSASEKSLPKLKTILYKYYP